MPFREILVAGVNLVRTAIQSAGYVANVSGWRIEKDGDAFFNDVDIRGRITVGGDTEPQVIIDQGGGGGYVQFPTNGIHENLEAYIIASALNAGAANEYESLQIQGPSTDGATDSLRLSISSQNNNGTSNANFQLGASNGDNLLSIDKDKTILASENNKLQWGATDSVAGGQYYEKLHRNAALVLTNNTSIPIIYDTRDFLHGDYSAAFDTSTGIWTCPEDGYYLISAGLQVDALAGAATRCRFDFRDDVGTNRFAASEHDGGIGMVDSHQLTLLQWWYAADKMAPYYFQNSGANRNMAVAASLPRSISFKRLL